MDADNTVKPNELRIVVGTLTHWEASASHLLDWLRTRISDSSLTTIAEADYGANAAKHLAALRTVCETGRVPRAMDFGLHEVMALTRWWSGQPVDHWARALSCTLLCLVPSESDELLTNGIVLIDSCEVLGLEACRGAELLFAWYAESKPLDGDEDDPERVAALQLLLTLRARTHPNDPHLVTLATSLLEHPEYPPDTVARWIADSMRANEWAERLEECLALAEAEPIIRLFETLVR